MSALSLRERAGEWIESRPVQNFIIALIVINAVILGLQTDTAVMTKIGTQLELADTLILSVFVAEIAIKLYAFGLGFFKPIYEPLMIIGTEFFIYIEGCSKHRIYRRPADATPPGTGACDLKHQTFHFHICVHIFG